MFTDLSKSFPGKRSSASPRNSAAGAGAASGKELLANPRHPPPHHTPPLPSRRNPTHLIAAASSLAGAEGTHESEYPGWKPSLKSHTLEVCKASYRRLYGKDPVVRAIHAGLECGLFLDKYPHLDMISFGPTLRGVHAPGERLDLASLDRFVLLLEDVIRECK